MNGCSVRFDAAVSGTCCGNLGIWRAVILLRCGCSLIEPCPCLAVLKPSRGGVLDGCRAGRRRTPWLPLSSPSFTFLFAVIPAIQPGIPFLCSTGADQALQAVVPSCVGSTMTADSRLRRWCRTAGQHQTVGGGAGYAHWYRTTCRVVCGRTRRCLGKACCCSAGSIAVGVIMNGRRVCYGSEYVC